MKRRLERSTACALALAAALACGPVPGGSLSGQPTAVPASWASVVDGRSLCEIESRPADPHSIQLDCFLWQGGLYVQSHRWALASWWPTTSWAEIWLEQPGVKVRIGEQLFDARAVHVAAGRERDAILGERGYDPVPDGIVLFRFEAL